MITKTFDSDKVGSPNHLHEKLFDNVLHKYIKYWRKFLIRTLFAIRRDIYCANSCLNAIFLGKALSFKPFI